jgi:hypothetical protein
MSELTLALVRRTVEAMSAGFPEETILKRTENRFTSFLAFIFMLGLGCIPLWLAGGIVGWIFFFLFAVGSLLPLSSVIQPETSQLASEDGELVWWTAKQGKRTEEASVSIGDIRKVIQLSHPGSRLVEIQLVLADKTVLVLPQGLMPEVNARKILSGIKGLSPAIEIGETEAETESAGSAPGDVDTTRPEHRHASAKAQTQKAESGWTFNEKNVWKYTLGFVVVGVALLVIAVTWGISTFQFVRAASPADGLVQKMDLVGRPGHHAYQPTVVFTDQAGQTRTFTESGSDPPAFRVGQRVRVLYDRNDPSRARIKAFSTLWLFQTFIGVLGLAFTIMGSVGTWQARKLYS